MTSSARRRRAVVVVVAVAALVPAACGDGTRTGGAPTASTSRAPSSPAAPDLTSNTAPTPTAGDGSRGTEIEATTVISLDEPIVLLPRPGDDHLWVAERAGTIHRLATTSEGALRVDGEPVLDLSDQTSTDAERGLLGLAFSADGGTIYVSHTDAGGDTRLAAYPIVDDSVVADDGRDLFTADQPYANHNGGNVVLGPDGLLWLGLGDGGSGNDPDNVAQDPRSPLGKLLRIDPDAPPGTEPEIVASGLRNPWRFSFDTDDSLWIGDVGQSRWEEIDHLPADRIDGANLGWSALEGTHENPDVDPDRRRGNEPIPPVFEYAHDGGNCSVTGGFVYRGEALPGLHGAYLFADYCAGTVRALRLADDGTVTEEADLGVDVSMPISFGTDADGEAYVLSGEGDIVRLGAGG